MFMHYELPGLWDRSFERYRKQLDLEHQKDLERALAQQPSRPSLLDRVLTNAAWYGAGILTGLAVGGTYVALSRD